MKNITRKILSFALSLAMIVPMFVFPSAAADTAPELITSVAGYSNIEVRVTTDKAPLSYRIGDTVTFTMKVYADNVHVSVPMIKCWLEGDGNTAQGVEKFRKEYTLRPDANGVFSLTENVISIPGYMRLEGSIYSADGTTRWAETPNNDRAYTLGAGILVNYEEITTVMPEPADFDTVWDDRLKDLYAVAPKIVRIDKVTKYYSGSSLQNLSSVTNRDVYAVYIECPGNSGDVLISDSIGNQAGATWAVAYITVPTGKSDGTMSFSQGYQGYGINTATPSTSTGNIGINMATHSVVLLNNENAASADTYKSKYASYIKGGASYGKDATDNSAIDTCYFANLLLRDLQMLRFAKQAFGPEGAASLITDETVIKGMTKTELLAEMEYWKGLYNGQITTSGGSQGGFQAIGVAALDHDVDTVSANIPWMGDTHISTDTARLQGASRPTIGEGIRYCDTAFLAARVEATVTITARLVDKSCVPTGVISIWNNLVNSKKDVKDYIGAITWVQSGTHGYQPTYPENPTQVLRTYELVEPAGIPNNNGEFTKSGYTDIDGYTVDQDAQPPETGYVQIGTDTQAKATVAEGFTPSLYYQNGANVYYNAELKKLVYVTTNKIIAEYGKHTASPSQNTNAVGNTWFIAYWAAQNNLNIKDIEFRYGTGGSQFSGFGYVTSLLTVAQTAKYDTRLNGCSWGGEKSTSVVVGMTSLKSLGHGSFDNEGKFTATTYKDGVVDLTGFTNFSASSYWNYMLYNCTSVTEVVTNTIAGANMFEGCIGLKTVTVPATAAFTSIGANNFKNCNKLERINVQCAVSSLALGSNAFSGNDIVISVITTDDKAIVDAALNTAGITNVTVVAIGDSTNALSADGFSVRTEDYTGLRSIFSFNSNLIPYYASNGLTLSEYGALMMSSDNFETLCGGDEKAMYDLGVAGTSTKVKYIPVHKMVDGVQKGRNKYLSVEDGVYTYCVTLTGIPEANYKDDVYICAYAKWVDASGNETLEFVHYTDSLGQGERSLYDVTAAAYKMGVVNSALAPDFDTVIWSVLKTGAVTVGGFKYLDVPYYTYTWYTDEELTTPATDINGGLNYFPGNETPTESGIVWSLIEYGNEYIATYRLADGAEPTTLPRLTYSDAGNGYTVFQPFDSRFNGAENGKNYPALETLSPTLASADAALVTTLVIDSGITGTNTYSLAYMPTVKTLVMPKDFKTLYTGAFHGCTNLTTAYTAGGEIAEDVIDLSALDTITTMNRAFTECSSAVNIKLPAGVPLRNAYASFKNCKKLERVWVDGSAMPEKGVIDLSGAPLLTINADMLKNAALINTLICPDETTLSSVGCLASAVSGAGTSNPYSSTTNVNIKVKEGSAGESAIRANLTNDQFAENKIAINGIAITNTGDLEIDFGDAWD